MFAHKRLLTLRNVDLRHELDMRKQTLVANDTIQIRRMQAIVRESCLITGIGAL